MNLFNEMDFNTFIKSQAYGLRLIFDFGTKIRRSFNLLVQSELNKG